MPARPAKRSSSQSKPRLSISAKMTVKLQPKADRPFAPNYGIVGAEDGKGLLSWAWVARKMNNCRTFWLATIHAGRARPHVMPVWGVWLDDAFFFSTGRKSRKGQNLAANPACTITNDDGQEAVIVEGLAIQAEDAAEQERVAVAYKKKYKMDPRSMGDPFLRAQLSRVFVFVENPLPHSATRWRL